MNIIPDSLINQIQEGNVVLFIGSAFNNMSFDNQKRKYPSSDDIKTLLIDKFLDNSYKKSNTEVGYIFDICVNKYSMYEVEEYIYKILRNYEPSKLHYILPEFVWKAIFTTNIDLMIEKAYQNKKNIQNIVSFKKNGESINEKVHTSKDLIYTKLHGCISDISENSAPLILSTSQYDDYQSNRSRLFDRLIEYAYDYPFLFIANSFADNEIIHMLKYIKNKSKNRPTSYIVAPNINDDEVSLWENYKIQSIKLNIVDFFDEINKKIDKEIRKLAIIKTSKYNKPIFNRFKVSIEDLRVTDSLLNFIENDIDYIHENLNSEDTIAKEFYKGYFDSWDPIIKKFDVERSIKDSIMLEVFLSEDDERRSKQDFYVVKAKAGAGKSVLLKRIAWDAANIYGKLCIFIKQNCNINYSSIVELYNYCKERIFLFIDRVSDYIDDIKYIISKANKNELPITIISSERKHIWNTDCEPAGLEEFLTATYELEYLNELEIINLLDLLDKHNSLGDLKYKNIEERQKSLAEKSGRSLLVALHEATFGKPFEDIILDEYNSIADERAKSLYLTVCILHRLGVSTRAGLISRVHGIPFHQFKDELFKKLEFIVFSNYFNNEKDFVYKTRHPHIADMVFETVLKKPEQRFEQYKRLICKLNVDYQSDKTAFLYIMNAKKLLEISKDFNEIKYLYKIAHEVCNNNIRLMQQEAIFEMEYGHYNDSESILKKALKIESEDIYIKHSLAELFLKKAENASDNLLRNKFILTSKSKCKEIINFKKQYTYAYHTLLKIILLEIKTDIEGSGKLVEDLIKEFDNYINYIKKEYGEDDRVLDSEAKLNELLDNKPKALEILERAYEKNKNSAYIVSRLAKYYEKKKDYDKAINILKEALNQNSTNKDLNFQLGILLMNKIDYLNYLSDIKNYLRNSFIKEDARYENQFWYAICAYIMNDFNESKSIFNYLKNIRNNINNKNPRGLYKKDNTPIIFLGIITKLEVSFGFVKRDGTNDEIFFSFKNITKDIWDKLQKGRRVSFSIAFNYDGAIAINMNIIK